MSEIIGTVSSSLQENINYMNKILPVKESFDLIQRDIIIGERKSTFYFVDGMMKDEAMVKIMSAFFAVKKEDMPYSASGFSKMILPYVEVDILNSYNDIVRNLLSGVTCLFVDGYEACICIDCRTYPARGVEEPDKDRALRGSRDGFVEERMRKRRKCPIICAYWRKFPLFV